MSGAEPFGALNVWLVRDPFAFARCAQSMFFRPACDCGNTERDVALSVTFAPAIGPTIGVYT
jgi:hypothetical protein